MEVGNYEIEQTVQVRGETNVVPCIVVNFKRPMV